MNYHFFSLMCTLFLLIGFLSGQETPNEAGQKDTTDTVEIVDNKKDEKKPKEPKFLDVVEDYEKIEGLFTLYHSEKEGKVYLEIRQDQFGPVFLCSITRESGDASIFDSGAMLGEFPFFIKMIGKQIQFIRKNTLYRADSEAAIHRAVERNFSNSLWNSAKVASQPHPDIGSVLVEAADIFLDDYTDVNHITSRLKIPYSFDKKNSYFSLLKSFPLNSELEVTLHFKSSKPQPLFSLPDSRSMFHRYHYSLSALPETGYKPRVADDRLGHILNIYQDYSSQLEDTPYRWNITRWQLEKSEPKFTLSKPKKPIVFWIENTIPVEYRDAVREGILLWNDAFEKIGFEDALVVKQMPDDAEWDPADVRYNTVRWIVQPGSGYAVGPSRANPFTGQIYDADIRVSADYVRFYYREFGEFVTPMSWTDLEIDQSWPFSAVTNLETIGGRSHLCQFAQGMKHQMAFGWSLFQARGLVHDNPEELKKFIHNGIVDLIVHEMGHVLGLRHNFESSSTLDLAKLTDKDFTNREGISGSVMDYNAINVSPKGKQQGNPFQTVLGPYDYWVIEYAYKPLDPDSKTSEREMLEKIAQRGTDPRLQYGTDEDAFGLSTRGIDPHCNLWDLGNDPLVYYDQRITMSQELWDLIPDHFEQKAERYQKFRLIFGQGLTEYVIAAANMAKYVGGIYSNRDHIDDPGGRPPFQMVPAEKQREALHLLTENFFAPNSFEFSPELLNKLAPEFFWDFEGTPFRRLRIDYPIHGMVQLIQASALFRLYDPINLQRMQDNEVRFPKDQKPFTMAEMFGTLREAVWQELQKNQNINSFRRELQRMHLFVLNRILLQSPSILPHDAISLARNDMMNIGKAIDRAFSDAEFDSYTAAHLEETRAKIKAALDAQLERSY